MPGFYLKRMVMDNFNSKEVDPDIADSIDFMVENVSLSKSFVLPCLYAMLLGNLSGYVPWLIHPTLRFYLSRGECHHSTGQPVIKLMTLHI
jgi:hypothetical protein